jgi:hypothetical protein
LLTVRSRLVGGFVIFIFDILAPRHCNIIEGVMSSASVPFGLRVETIPFVNVRTEFHRNRRILSAPTFREQVANWQPGNPLHAEYIVWGGPPSRLLTWFVQRTIIGVEAYIPSAAFMAGVHYRRLSPELVRASKEPFSLGCQSAANTFYNCLPALVDQTFRLKFARGSVWKSVRVFYETVRNPLFHGAELGTEGHQHVQTLDAVLKSLDLFVAIYEWVDWWFPPALLDVTGAVPVATPPLVQRSKRESP